MSETERYMPFWGEVLIYLAPSLFILTLALYTLTKELLIIYLMCALMVAFLMGLMWATHNANKSRLGIRGILGFLLIFFSNFVSEWIWVQLCLVLLGSGVMLYDVTSKRNLPDAE